MQPLELNARNEIVVSAGQVGSSSGAGAEEGGKDGKAIPKKPPFNKSGYLDMLGDRELLLKRAQEANDLNSGSDEEDVGSG